MTWRVHPDQAAAALGALAVAEPASAAALLGAQLEGLASSARQLVSLVGPFGAQVMPCHACIACTPPITACSFTAGSVLMTRRQPCFTYV